MLTLVWRVQMLMSESTGLHTSAAFIRIVRGKKKEVWVEKIGAFTMSPQTLQPQPALVFSFQSGGDSVLTWCKGRVQSPPLWRGLERDLGLWCPFMVFSAKTDDLRLFAACWWRSDKRCELLQTICSFYFVLYTPGKLPERDPAL